MALTATATPDVQDDIINNLKLNPDNLYRALHPFNRANLFYEVRYVSGRDPQIRKEDIRKYIRTLYQRRGKVSSGIIYCRTKDACEKLSQFLRADGINAGCYYRGITPSKLDSTLRKWLDGTGEIDVIVATIAFGMGIDKGDVRYIIHYDIPKSFEGYYQETGRAGRDGKPAKCVLYFSREDCLEIKKWVMSPKERIRDDYQGPPPTQRAGDSLDSLFAFAESISVCRHVSICRYFKEDIDTSDKAFMKTICDEMCDVCKYPEKTATRHARLSMIDVGDCRSLIAARSVGMNAGETNGAGRANSDDWANLPRAGLNAKRAGSSLDKGREDFKKQKVTFAPMLKTKPHASASGLNKPFKPPSLLGATNRQAATSRQPSIDHRSPARGSPLAVPKQPVARAESPILIEDDDELNARPAHPSSEDDYEEQRKLFDPHSHAPEPEDDEGQPPFRDDASSPAPIEIESDTECDSAAPSLSNPFSTKVQLSKRNQAFVSLHNALRDIFIAHKDRQRFWTQVKGPTDASRRENIIHSVAVEVEADCLVHCSTESGYQAMVQGAAEAIEELGTKTNLWFSQNPMFSESQEVLDLVVKHCR